MGEQYQSPSSEFQLLYDLAELSYNDESRERTVKDCCTGWIHRVGARVAQQIPPAERSKDVWRWLDQGDYETAKRMCVGFEALIPLVELEQARDILRNNLPAIRDSTSRLMSKHVTFYKLRPGRQISYTDE